MTARALLTAASLGLVLTPAALAHHSQSEFDLRSKLEVEGVVTKLAPALGTPRITTRGPRRPNDVEVLEVLIALDGMPPLLTGMRVDVFFRHETAASAVPTR